MSINEGRQYKNNQTYMKKILSLTSSRQRCKPSTRKHSLLSPSLPDPPTSANGSLAKEREKAYRHFPTIVSAKAIGRQIRSTAKAE